jgi:hypothetical protein
VTVFLCIFILYFNTFSDNDVLFILSKTEKLLITQVAVFISVHQRWSEYNTNVLEYEYDYFEHA